MSCGERLIEQLREHAVRVTPQRAVILETIAHLDGHPTAQAVYERASASLPGLNLATVYRTLEMLQSAGIVDLFHTGSGSVRFALRQSDDPHGHLVCQICGEVLEFDPLAARDLTRRMAAEHKFALDINHLTLRGTCGDCQNGDSN